MELFGAIVLGALIGVAGFVPMFKMAGKARAMLAEKNNTGSVGLLLLSLAISFLVMIVACVICAKVARDVLLPFTFAMVVGLSATAIVYGIRSVKK